MMNFKYTIVLFTILYGHHIVAQETQKCWLGNSTCEEIAYTNLARNVIANGIPELDIPSMVPLPLYDTLVPFLNMLTATLVEGYCEGINTCRILSFVSDAKSFRRISEIQCARIAIKGSYTLTTDPYFCKLIGEVSGCGNVSIVAEDWYYKFDYPYKFVKGEDGEITMDLQFDAGTYISKVLKSLTVSFDKITVNGDDITEDIVSFVNKYWELVLETIGKPFHDVSLDYYFQIYRKYYGSVPATDAYYDDLTQYLEN